MNNDLADRPEIEALFARYNWAIDDDDFDDWANCFTPDGVFEGVMETFHAHAELGKFKAHAQELIEKLPNQRHFHTSLEITVSGDSASARCFSLITSTQAGAGTQILMTGAYHDQLRRVDGKWLFSHRRVEVDGQTSGYAAASDSHSQRHES